MNLASTAFFVTRKSGEFAGSPKLLPLDRAPGVSTMALMAEKGVVGAVATPPLLPGVVMPLTVPAGCVGSVTV